MIIAHVQKKVRSREQPGSREKSNFSLENRLESRIGYLQDCITQRGVITRNYDMNNVPCVCVVNKNICAEI